MYEVPCWKSDIQRRIDALKQRVVRRELKKQMSACIREEKRKAVTDNQS